MLTSKQIINLLNSNDPTTIQQVQLYLDLLEADKAKGSLKAFLKLFWGLVSPTPLREGWYLDALCEHLQALPDLKRLIINIPPRHAKSSLCSILLPGFMWITHPELKFICSSYSLKLATEHSILSRAVIESPQYQRHWGHLFKLRPDQNTKTRFSNNHLGIRLATSTGSGNTGEGCDVLIADDLNDVNKAESQLDRQSVITWWGQVMSTRMNPGGLDCKVVIAQRCHEEDISGHLLRNGDWTKLILPWEYDSKRPTVTSLWSDPRITDGEPLSDLLTPEKVKELKGGNGLGPTGFACQYNQRPAPKEGNVFQRSWFRTYQEDDNVYHLDVPIPKACCRRFITTDIAFSLKTSADFTVAQVWAITPHNHLLLLHQYRDRVESPAALKAFREVVNVYQPDAIWLEDFGTQKGYSSFFRQAGLPVKALQHQQQDKKSRAQRAIVKAECGQVWLPQSAPWLAEWFNEVEQFPNASHDDQVDALAWAGIVSKKYPIKDVPVVETPEEHAKRTAEERQKKEQEFLWGD